MNIGIFAKTYLGQSFPSIIERIIDEGYQSMHFNFSCVGLSPLPTDISPEIIGTIKESMDGRPLNMCGVSATFNMIHPDPTIRNSGLHSLKIIAQHCLPIGTSFISLCTGTRNETDKWKAHPDNGRIESWSDLLSSMENAIRIAEEHDIRLGVEPEIHNVVNSISKARDLLNEMKSPHLRIIFDVANLIESDMAQNKILSIIDEGLDMLGDSLEMVHAKDYLSVGQFGAPGKGIIPFNYLIQQLKAGSFNGPIVVHGIQPSEGKLVANYLSGLI